MLLLSSILCTIPCLLDLHPCSSHNHEPKLIESFWILTAQHPRVWSDLQIPEKFSQFHLLLCKKGCMDIIINSKAMRSIGHVNNIPTKQFFTGISRNTQSKFYNTLSLPECVWDFRNKALWDTHQHALFCVMMVHDFRHLYIMNSLYCKFDDEKSPEY